MHWVSERYLEPSRTFTIFGKTFSRELFSRKSSIVDVRPGSQYASADDMEIELSQNNYPTFILCCAYNLLVVIVFLLCCH